MTPLTDDDDLLALVQDPEGQADLLEPAELRLVYQALKARCELIELVV